jgi:putative membrane protein
MLAPSISKNDRKARWLIIIFSVIVFTAIMILSRVKINVNLGFDVHLFATANALLNSCVALLLVIALLSVKTRNYKLHRNVMLTAMLLSVLFLISYICHHLFAGETRFGDINHDGLISPEEKSAAGSRRILYYILLGTHIPLAGIILPFILFTAYRGLTGEYTRHKKLARITWPIWFYVAATGVIVYWMIHPYYS